MENCLSMYASHGGNGEILLHRCKLANLVIPPLAKLSKEDAQILVDSLAECGVRTTQEPTKQDLIKGYTAEQWQEIIDGGYLCEARDVNGREWVPVTLLEFDDDGTDYDFKIKYSAPDDIDDEESHNWLRHCRPAQIKGVRRPIWVEPIDKEAMCVFFCKSNIPLYAGPMEDEQSAAGCCFGYRRWAATAIERGATSYMEI